MIEELRRLLSEATPGPYAHVGGNTGFDIEPMPVGIRGGFDREADARLIAAAVNALPELLAAVAERDELRTIVRLARQRLYDAHGRGPETTAEVIRAVGAILRRVDSPTTTTKEGP